MEPHELFDHAVELAWRVAEDASAQAEGMWEEYDQAVEAVDRAQSAARLAEDVAIAARKEAQRLERAARHQRALEARSALPGGSNGSR